MELPTTLSQQRLSTKDYFQLEDLLAYYPPSDTSHIQTIFTSKKEFNELKSSANEPPPKKGEFFKHQKLIQRFMRAVDKLLILHEAGTGKTCTMLAVSEFYEMMSRTLEGMSDSLLRQGFPIKKTYVIVRNEILRDEFINQLVCTCTIAKYETKYVKEAKDERSRMSRIKKEIGRWYEVLTFREFSNRVNERKKEGLDVKGKNIYKIESKLSDEEIKEEFSNCLFFADEIHNLRNVEGDFGEITDEDKESSMLNYTSMWQVFHAANNIKIMLATATPMINDPSDLVPILNLLLPVEKQVSDGTDFAKWKLKDFEKLVRGMVSYVRVLDTGIDVVYEGEQIKDSYVNVAGKKIEATSIIDAIMMSPFQSRAYLDAEVKESKGGKGGIRKAARHASNFVFPREIEMKQGQPTFNDEEIGRYGVDGFEKYVIEDENKNYKFKPDFLKLIQPFLVNIEGEEQLYTNLIEFSSKFVNVIQLCEKSPGSCFCYTDDFATASGAVLLGLCFEVFGFKKYNPTSTAFEISGSKSSGFCTKENTDDVRRIKIKPEKRYAILTSQADRETVRNMLTLFNSKENMNGEYIKVFIASRKAREGLNLANVQEIHLISPSWNYSNMYQAIYRAIRATSHVELLNSLRERAIIDKRNPDDVRVDVKIYQHCSTLSDEPEIQELSVDVGKPNFSVELQMYQHSEEKDRNNAVVMRMLKQCALDCQINKQRNQRPTDIDGTQTCNYAECNYECVDPPPRDIDFTTYDVYYKDELVEKIKIRLIELFEIKNTYTASEIFDKIQDFPSKFILQSLAEMIKDKVPFTNRYGYTSFLAENGNQFYLINELNAYSTEDIQNLYDTDVNTIGKTEYNENLYAVGRKEFDETIRALRKPIDDQKAVQLLTSENLLDDIEKIDANILITLIENILLKQKRKEDLTEQELSVISKYKNLIYFLKEPLTLIQETQEKRSEPIKPKRGRRPDLNKPAKITNLKKDLVIEDIEFGEPVVVHILDLLRGDKTAYKTSSRFAKLDANIRILKNIDFKWRDVTDIEKLAYNKLLQFTLGQEMKRLYGDKDIYGTVLNDDVFRIIDKTKENAKAKKNRHYTLKGRECVDLRFQELTDIMYRINLAPENFGISVKPYPKEKSGLEKFLQKEKEYSNTDKMSMDQLLEAAKWASTGLIKDGLCEIIQEYFEQERLLYRLISQS
jgi:hypothetical protein